MSLLIQNIAHGWVGDAAGARVSGAIRVKDGVIAQMGDLRPLPGEDVLDATGCVVAPGLVNTHHHLFQSVLKGLALDAALDDWLQQVPYMFWPQIDEETLRISARIGLAELALSGATTVCDHHYVFSQRYDYDPAEVLFEEAARFGLRFVLARGGMTKGRDFGAGTPPPPTETLRHFLDGTAATAKRWHDPSEDAMTRVACAPTTPNFNFATDTLPEIAAEARSLGLRLHAHLSENTAYATQTLAAFGQRPVPWLASKGWLGPDVWFAHLVDLTPDEVAMLAETGTGMAHCPQANARLGSGVAPAPAFAQAGGLVSLAVDGAGANEAAHMGAAMYAAFAMHRAVQGVTATRASTVLHWATQAGAQTLGLRKTGTLAPGMAADLVLFDLAAPQNLGLHDPALAPIVTGSAHVRHSLCAGRFVVKDGQIAHLDMPELHHAAARVTAHLKETEPA